MANLTVTGKNMLAGLRRAKQVYFTWEPAVAYYQDSADSWYASIDGLRWVRTIDPRLVVLSTMQIHGVGSLKANAIVVSSLHSSSFSHGFSGGFG